MPLIRKNPPGPTETTSPGTPPADSLASGTAEERWKAARRLGTPDTPGGVQLLAKALEQERDARVREAIFTSLTRLGGPESVEAVIGQLHSDEAHLRTGALDALRAMIGSVRPRLAALLADPDPDIRILSCDLVRELPSAEGTALLSAVLENDPEPNVCAVALDILAETGDAAALPALDKCAARFPEERFLIFALRIARERIVAQAPAPRG